MADWRIRKRYGHGAARVVMCPESCRGAAAGGSFAADLREVGPDLFGGVKSGIVFGIVIVATFLFTAMRDRADFSQTQLAVWRAEEPAPIPEPFVPEPVELEPRVEPEIAKVEPKPVPVPKPAPEPVKIAKKVEPKPVPKPVTPVRPQRPKIEIAALADASVPKVAAVERKRTVVIEPERRKVAAIDAPVMNALDLPKTAPGSPSRTQRVTQDAKRRQTTVPVVAVAQSALSLPDSTVDRAPRRTAPAFAPAKSRARPDLQVATASAPRIATSAPAPRRERPAAVVANTGRGQAPRVEIGAAPAALAPHNSTSSASLPAPSRVVAHAAAVSKTNRAGEPDVTLRGVSLGSLASCMSDREEDLLKQRVLAAVRNRGSCESSFGTYRFVETKNLNAFSMWIERAPGRKASDRCVELTHALACLE